MSNNDIPESTQQNLTIDERKDIKQTHNTSTKNMHLDVDFHDVKDRQDKFIIWTQFCVNTACTCVTGLIATATLIVTIVALANK